MVLQHRHRQLTREDEDVFIDRVISCVDFWTPIIGLDTWAIHVAVGDLEGDRASVESDAEYRSATITFNHRRMWHADEEEIEEVVVHELTHLRVAEFMMNWDNVRKRGRQKLEESLVSDVTGAITRAFTFGLEGACWKTER